jgi:nicotinamidase-related amidase
MRHEKLLDQKQTALLIIDMQEAFRQAISDFTETAARIALVAHAAHLLRLPLIITEQYPQGLGRTVNEIRAVLPDLAPIEKDCFSACDAPLFRARLEETGARQVVVCGIEAHICINQTVHDLLARGYQVHILTDCITSRAAHNKHAAVAKMQMNGAMPSTTEMMLFELLRDSRHEQFKAIQRLIK